MTDSEKKIENEPKTWFEIAYGSNEIRLSTKIWIFVFAFLLALLLITPEIWPKIEKIRFGENYRIPYSLGFDYWMYNQYSRFLAKQPDIITIGDSVVWGHYVTSTQTLSYFLSEMSGKIKFANAGLDGIHPVAMEGLIKYYGKPFKNKKLIVHCNMLWMTSPTADLQFSPEELELKTKNPKAWNRQKEARLRRFNHPKLAAQFISYVPRNEADFTTRVEYAVGRHFPFYAWVTHIRCVYFEGKDILSWISLHPYENPFKRLSKSLPSPDEEPIPPPDKRPWTERGLEFNPCWVPLSSSYQWRSFRRTLELLERRGNTLFVVIGPMNEHMFSGTALDTYRAMKKEIEQWLASRGIPYFSPSVLPSNLYADASHPLSEGYRIIAKELFENPQFRKFAELQ
jgi:hypothetical protein